MSHELFRQHVLPFLHRLDGDWGVQVKRKGDDDRFDAVVVEQCIDPAVRSIVDFDVLLRFGFAGVLVLLDKPRSGRSCPIAVKSPIDAVWTNVCNSGDLDVLRGATANQHATFVPRSDHTDTDRISIFFIAKIHRTQSGATDRTGSNHALKELSTGKTHRFVVIVLSDCFVFCTESTHAMTSMTDKKRLNGVR